MFTLGIDPGKKASAVILSVPDYKMVEYVLWNAKSKGFHGQYAPIFPVQKLLYKYNPQYIGIEIPGVSNKGTALKQGFGIGSLYQLCLRFTTPSLINCTKVHSLVGSKTSILWASKKGYSLPGVNWKDDTISDSIALAILAVKEEGCLMKTASKLLSRNYDEG